MSETWRESAAREWLRGVKNNASGLRDRWRSSTQRERLRSVVPASRRQIGDMVSRLEEMEARLSRPSHPIQPTSVPARIEELDAKITREFARLHHPHYRLSREAKWNAILNHQLQNYRRLDRLVERVSRGHIVRVIFLVSYPGKFGFDTVYEEMRRNPLFEPLIVVVHAFDRDGSAEIRAQAQREARESYELFRERGYEVRLGYEPDGTAIDLDQWAPDIIFLNNPNLFQNSSYKNISMNFRHLVCYISYGMYVVEDPEYQFNYFPINSAWINFVDMPFTYYWHVHARSQFHGYNAVLAGYPKLDRYRVPDPNNPLPSKLDNGKPIVIIAPHWSVRTEGTASNMATFHLYHRTFAELRRSHPDINFVFKPHPDLHLRLRQSIPGAPSFNDYTKYLSEWDSAPNGLVVTEGEYIELFRRSSCLITDSGSFIAEYLPSGHPCIYLLNPEKKNPLSGYNSLGRRILDTYYTCSSESELLRAFRQLITQGRDPRAERRVGLVESEFINVGTAGRFIVDYLERQLRPDSVRPRP